MAENLSEKVQKIVDAVAELSLMEVSELVSALEEKFGVSAAPVMMAGAAAPAAAAAEEKTEFDVVMTDGGANKIGAIKAIRALKPELGLAEAKKFVESAPQVVLAGADKDAAEAAKKTLEEAGATVELK
jgi:large subunit ribosomal protein L7/L12